jgi:hypothetical protein
MYTTATIIEIVSYAVVLYIVISLQKRKLTTQRKLITVLLSVVIFMSINSLLIISGSYIFHTPSAEIVEPNGSYRIIISMIDKLMLFMISSIVIKISNVKGKLAKTEWILIFLLYIVSLIIMCLVYNTEKQSNIGINTLIIISGVVLINVINFFVYKLIMKLHNENLEYSLKIQSAEFNNKLTEYIEDGVKKLRTARHDMKGHFNTILNLIENKQYDKAVEYIKEYSDDCIAYDSYINTKDEVFNFVSNSLLTKAKKNNVEVDVLTDNDVTFDLTPLEITSVVTNIINNAIENLEKQTNPHLIFKIYFYKDYSVLKVKNSIEKSVLQDNPLLKTTKSDTQNHGLGLDNVKNIVEAHNGFVNIQEKNNMFEVGIYILNS